MFPPFKRVAASIAQQPFIKVSPQFCNFSCSHYNSNPLANIYFFFLPEFCRAAHTLH